MKERADLEANEKKAQQKTAKAVEEKKAFSETSQAAK